MSLYTIATSSLTTRDDRRRRPAVSYGQVTRTLVMCLIFAVALVAARRGHAEEISTRGGFHGFVESVEPQAHRSGVSHDTLDRALSGVTPEIH